MLLFSGLPGGYRNNNGNFNNIGNNGIWWSSTENSTSNAWNRNLNYNNTNINRNNNNKEYGFSVRCARDLKTVGAGLSEVRKHMPDLGKSGSLSGAAISESLI